MYVKSYSWGQQGTRTKAILASISAFLPSFTLRLPFSRRPFRDRHPRKSAHRTSTPSYRRSTHHLTRTRPRYRVCRSDGRQWRAAGCAVGPWEEGEGGAVDVDARCVSCRHGACFTFSRPVTKPPFLRRTSQITASSPGRNRKSTRGKKSPTTAASTRRTSAGRTRSTSSSGAARSWSTSGRSCGRLRTSTRGVRSVRACRSDLGFFCRRSPTLPQLDLSRPALPSILILAGCEGPR